MIDIMGSPPVLVLNCLFPAHFWKFSKVDSLRDQQVACSASDRNFSPNFESRVWLTVSSDLPRHPKMALMVFSLAFICTQVV